MLSSYRAKCSCGLDVRFLAVDQSDAEAMAEDYHSGYFTNQMCDPAKKAVVSPEVEVKKVTFGEDDQD